MAKPTFVPRRNIQPKPAFKQFFSMREVRVSSTTGHSAVIKANVPTELPKPLWNDAFKSGAMEYDPELIRAAARSIDRALPKKLTFDEALERAVRQIVANGKPTEINKVTGQPKNGAVKAAMAALGIPEKLLKGLTTDAIYDTFVGLESSSAVDETEETETEEEPDLTDLADEDGVDEPVGKGVAGLLGEAEGAETDEE